MNRTPALLAAIAFGAVGIGAAGWFLLRPTEGIARPGLPEDSQSLPGVDATPGADGSAPRPGSPGVVSSPEPVDGPDDDDDLDRPIHGEYGGATAEEILAALALGTPQGWLEAGRLLSIGGSNDPRVTAALLKALEDGQFRNRAAELAAHLKDPAALARFLDVAMKDGDDNTRAAALAACANMEGPGVFEAAASILRSAKPGGILAAAAAMALGDLGTAESTRVLLEALRESVGTPRQPLFAEALSRVKDADAIAEVARMASDPGVDAGLRTALVEAMGRSRNPDVVPELLKILRSDAEPAIRSEGLRALARIGSAEAVEELMNVLHGGDDGAKTQAAMALAEIRGKAAGPALEKAAEGPLAPELRSYVIDALGRTGSASSVEVLGRIARDANESAGLRRTALKSIGEIAAPAGAAVALDVLESGPKDDAALRMQALGALRATATAADVQRIEKLLAQSTPKTPEYFHLEAIAKSLKK